MTYTKPRGTQDLFGEKLEKFNDVCNILRVLADNFNFQEIITPTFESLELFTKSVGDTSDIVTKELYNFKDKGDRDIALRPEGTAGAVRAYVENKMFANSNSATKLFYLINLFRYERPQGGRLREFHQFGIEYLNTTTYLDDVECLNFADYILKVFNLRDKVTLKINNLGNFKQRVKWMDALKEYFKDYRDQLTEDSLNRLEKNPLRILDDKVDGAKDFVKQAPKLKDYLSSEDQDYFKNITEALDSLKIQYEIDDTLVRGLDYYTGLVFEFVSTDDELVGKSTLIGGGRYSNLIKDTGGPNAEGLGFAIGIERLILALDANGFGWQKENLPTVYIGIEDTSIISLSTLLSNSLISYDVRVKTVNTIFKRDKAARQAIKNNVDFFVFFEKDKILKDQKVYVENLKAKTHEDVLYSEVTKHILNALDIICEDEE